MVTEDAPIHPRERVVSWEHRLASHPESIGQARRHARYVLEPYADEDMLERVELVVSELVTNAVRHGPGELITLRLASTPNGGIAGEVVDQGDGVVAIREHGGALAGGLGLPIVDALTSDWGVYPGSTHVWFRFDAAAA
ncbi:MAG TPA: ATP-binding protein [Thermoleophilaceae bacterium]|nr:ATP-binding protein [Thermoleophilaceae bacterium]